MAGFGQAVLDAMQGMMKGMAGRPMMGQSPQPASRRQRPAGKKRPQQKWGKPPTKGGFSQ